MRAPSWIDIQISPLLGVRVLISKNKVSLILPHVKIREGLSSPPYRFLCPSNDTRDLSITGVYVDFDVVLIVYVHRYVF